MHTLFSASADKDIRVWNANTGLCRNLLKGHVLKGHTSLTSYVYSVRVSHIYDGLTEECLLPHL